MMMFQSSRCWLCVVIVVFHPVLFAQVCSTANCPPSDSDKAPPLRLDVISVKPADPHDAEGWYLNKTPDGFSARNLTLKKLIEQSFGIWDDGHLLGAPAWIDKERFGIEARVDDEDLDRFKRANRAQLQSMLQEILARRFSLKAHYEQRMDSVLILKSGKDGPKLTPSAALPAGEPQSTLLMSNTKSQVSILRCPTEYLAQFLSRKFGQTVIDETGLSGRYDVKLDLDTHDNDPGANSIGFGASLISAVKGQLGLELRATKRLVPYLVVDSVSRPDEN
jgi:uncharacterized protein (TIGR03435 family)